MKKMRMKRRATPAAETQRRSGVFPRRAPEASPGPARIEERRPYRAVATSGEALCIDPGAGGLLASAIRGKQPSSQAFGFVVDRPRAIQFVADPCTTAWGDEVPSSIDEGVAVLSISGPLEKDGWWWCSYEAIVREIGKALAHPAVRAVALKIDSPGGVAAGMGETHKAIRRMQKATGKPIFAFADEMACSAAYHLASACREVWTTEAGHVGSVGVILCTIDETGALDKAGVKIRYVVSGARKADLHPGQPVTDEVIGVAQAKVDILAGQFFRAVAKARGMTPEAVEALQAGVFIGADAVSKGLADGIASWPRFLSLVKDVARLAA